MNETKKPARVLVVVDEERKDSSLRWNLPRQVVSRGPESGEINVFLGPGLRREDVFQRLPNC